VRGDMAYLNAQEGGVPCPAASSGTLKCEACPGGCQLYDKIPFAPPPLALGDGQLGSEQMMATLQDGQLSLGSEQVAHPGHAGHLGRPHPKSLIGNERTHYSVPPGGNASIPDVILYRSGTTPFLWASVRTEPGQASWPEPVETNIGNDESNLNAGLLPDGRIYLVHNVVFRNKSGADEGGDEDEDEGGGGGLRMRGRSGELRFRDPITLATSRDGYAFDTAHAVVSCTQLTANSTCTPRYHGGGKNPGPSYPQGLTVVAPAPAELQGFYVINSNNKEDIWITKVPFSAF